MSEWQEVSLDTVAQINPTESLSKGAMAKKFAMDALQPFTKKPSRYEIEAYSGGMKFKNGDTVVARITPCLENGKTAYIDLLEENEVAYGSTEYIVLREKFGVTDKQFLYYFSISPIFRDVAIASMTGSSGRQRVQTDVVKQHVFEMPSLKEQKAIASVLSSLDDKIDLLNRQNTTLERMAETLFRQWFVEEAKEDWSFVVLGEYVNCFNGVSYKSSDLNASKTAMVTLKSFDRNGGFRLDGFKEFTGRYKEQHIVVQGDLVVAHTDITQDAEVIGNPVLVVASPSYETIVISMDLVKVTSKFDWLSNEFLYRMMRTREFKEHCLGYSNGSTVLHLSKQAIPSYEFFLPPKEKIQFFTANVKAMLGKKFKNIEQIQTLEKLRDTLLPKLMSGEVRMELVACAEE